jgi:ribosomal protein S6
MDENIDDRLAIYEIGYLIAASVAEENVSAEVEKIKKIISDAGASVIAEEMPRRQDLAYTIRRKTVSGSYDKYDQAYFGWIKFELATKSVVAMKKAIEVIPAVLRMILITTVRENTYLGKHAPVIAAKAPVVSQSHAPAVDEAPVVPVTIEEMDKSIDEMVKEA